MIGSLLPVVTGAGGGAGSSQSAFGGGGGAEQSAALGGAFPRLVQPSSVFSGQNGFAGLD